MTNSGILDITPLGGRWPTLDPFLFCAYHNDAYPAGAEDMGPAGSLAGRAIGQDFSGRDGWSMYHGDRVPGFPRHPHRGFETVTVARRGFIDHADSMGASARFGEGDLQWMTAGRGIVHSEMFPLRQRDRGNHTELFQIWLNLPAKDKMVESHFAMFWQNQIPRSTTKDDRGRETTVVSYCGALADGAAPPPPPPHSWAADKANGVVIWTIQMAPGAGWTLPPADPGCSRKLFFFHGDSLRMGGQDIAAGHGVVWAADASVELRNGGEVAEILLLQGRPINEPVAHHGPFVMNSQDELQQAFMDYQRTGFGGWQWPTHGPVHARDSGRFARFPDGRVESAGD
ncbi:MAG: pirin family protein [Alphaproteobacteria bacterium]